MKPVFTLGFLCLLVLMTGCSGTRGQRLEDIPTPADIHMLATAQVLTQNAPPPGYPDVVRFPEVDRNLERLDGWRYTVTLQFDGVFSRTTRETSASAHAEVWFNELGTARRVVVTTSGELLGNADNVAYEAVRLGPDAYLVQNGVCLENVGDDAMIAASLRAGELIGGVNQATTAAQKATLNSLEVWRYAFSLDDLHMPSIQLEEGGTIAAFGELWVAPAHDVVARFYATIDVTNARIFGRTLPVDGRAIIRYDLYDINQQFNITQPFGC